MTQAEINQMISAIRVMVAPMVIGATQIYAHDNVSGVAAPGASGWLAMNLLIVVVAWLAQVWVVYRVASALVPANTRACVALATAVPGIAGLLLSFRFSTLARAAKARSNEALRA